MKEENDNGNWVIGGTTLIGIGVGLIFLKTSVLVFVASTLIGMGSGLAIAPFVPKKGRTYHGNSTH